MLCEQQDYAANVCRNLLASIVTVYTLLHIKYAHIFEFIILIHLWNI